MAGNARNTRTAGNPRRGGPVRCFGAAVAAGRAAVEEGSSTAARPIGRCGQRSVVAEPLHQHARLTVLLEVGEQH
ncbi:hypothetical protein, partial [Marinitenerispora sediminis]|uniref:hypothetical protein n=1 Tax=Marinitenerispora sediminis TaxID=1931232 RepID=UPI000DFDBBF8